MRFPARLTIHSGGMESDIKSIREITSIKRLTAGPELFVVPAGYRKVDMPGPIRPPRR